jgi:hypothetical protein
VVVVLCCIVSAALAGEMKRLAPGRPLVAEADGLGVTGHL